MRALVSLLLGVVVAISLFLGMQLMTTNDAKTIQKSQNPPRLVYLSDRDDSELNERKRLKPKEIEKKSEPKKIVPIKTNISKIDQKIDVKPLKVTHNIDLSPKAFLNSPKIAVNASTIVDASTLKTSKRVNPRYPRAAKKRGKEGFVKLQFTILNDGSVTNVKIIESNPDDTFNEEALRAISKWRFKVNPNDGSKVASITFNFRLVK